MLLALLLSNDQLICWEYYFSVITL